MRVAIRQALFSKKPKIDIFGDSLVVAYSLRKVKPSYTGAAIRVRRSSDEASIDIGYVKDALDVNALQNFCGAGDGFISIWYDQSGRGFDATQMDVPKQLTIVKRGVINSINSKPSALSNTFDLMFIPSLAFAGLSSATEYAVFNVTTGVGAYGRVGSANDTNYAPFVDGNAYISFLSNQRAIFANYPPVLDLGLHTSVNNGSTLTIYRNYISKGTANITFNDTPILPLFPDTTLNTSINISEYIVTSNIEMVAFKNFTDYYRFSAVGSSYTRD